MYISRNIFSTFYTWKQIRCYGHLFSPIILAVRNSSAFYFLFLCLSEKKPAFRIRKQMSQHTFRGIAHKKGHRYADGRQAVCQIESVL